MSVYFPAAKWYSLYDYSVVDASSGSKTQSFEVRCLDWICEPRYLSPVSQLPRQLLLCRLEHS